MYIDAASVEAKRIQCLAYMDMSNCRQAGAAPVSGLHPQTSHLFASPLCPQ
jgi:hypothetical protein